VTLHHRPGTTSIVSLADHDGGDFVLHKQKKVHSRHEGDPLVILGMNGNDAHQMPWCRMQKPCLNREYGLYLKATRL
jgi:hypothetical protein